MIWASWADFWAMGGHALYVWGSAGVFAALIMGEVWSLARRQRSAIQAVRARQARTGVARAAPSQQRLDGAAAPQDPLETRP